MSIYFFIGLIFLISRIIVYITIKTKYNINGKHIIRSGINGIEIVNKMLSDNKVNDILILKVKKMGLFSKYNPDDKKLYLSRDVCYQSNLMSISIALHECSHALQHNSGYKLLLIRSRLLSVIKVISKMTEFTIMLGITIFYGSNGKVKSIFEIGMILFFLLIIYSVVSFPVEFNANRRLLFWVKNNTDSLNNIEYNKIKISLQWSIMLHIVVTLGNITQFLYLISVIKNGFMRIIRN